MAKIYANLIVKGKKTLEDVPESIRSAVEAVLINMGYSIE